MFLAFVLHPPSEGHAHGTMYVLAAKVEGTTVTVSSFYMGHRQESVFELSKESLRERRDDSGYHWVQSIIDSMSKKKYPFVTLSTPTTYEQLVAWQKDYANKKKEPKEFFKQMMWACSTKKNYCLGNNCSDEALRVLRDGCGIFPKTTTFAKIIESICATTLCLSTCACVGCCVCGDCTAPTFPLVVNTPQGVFYALQRWANQTEKQSSVNFLDYIYGKTGISTDLKTDRFKEEKVKGPEQQVMVDAPKMGPSPAGAVRFWMPKKVTDRPSIQVVADKAASPALTMTS